MILEQNSVPGLTNKILGKIVKAVCTNYQESIPYFPERKDVPYRKSGQDEYTQRETENLLISSSLLKEVYLRSSPLAAVREQGA